MGYTPLGKHLLRFGIAAAGRIVAMERTVFQGRAGDHNDLALPAAAAFETVCETIDFNADLPSCEPDRPCGLAER